MTGIGQFRRVALMVLLAGVTASACAKKSAPSTAAPGGAADAAAAPEYLSEEGDVMGDDGMGGDSGRDFAQTLPDYEAELDRLEGELASAGVRIPGLDVGVTPTPASDDARCARVCGLADAICDLEANICRLASDHEDDERYANACARAQTDCERAELACEACGDG